MFKSITTLAVALSVSATSAEASDFPSRSQREAAAQSGYNGNSGAPTYRPGHTLEHGIRARVVSNVLQDQCITKNRGERYMDVGVLVIANQFNKGRNRSGNNAIERLLTDNRSSRSNQRDCNGNSRADYSAAMASQPAKECRTYSRTESVPGQPDKVFTITECQETTTN